MFRHTFCTNMANAGMDIKSLQYVMEYSEVGVTLNVYTHANYDRTAEQMAKIINFAETESAGRPEKWASVSLQRDIKSMIKILFICHGSRSPIFKNRVFTGF